MQQLSHTVERKFVDDIECGDEWALHTDTGWHDLINVLKTIEYEIYTLTLDNGYFLKCADNHIVFLEDFSEIFVKNLQLNDRIITEQGLASVVSVIHNNEFEHMYDVSVDSQDHRFFSNGILSHNTTCAQAYLLWEAMFKDDQTILVVSNVFAAAGEIMERIRHSYECLPAFLKPGVEVYNRTSITFDNGSRIFARATTKNSGRGLSLSILYSDELSSVDVRKQNEFYAAIRPTLSTGGKCIVTSTPGNDEDIFAQIWQGALDVYDEYGNERPNKLGRNGFKALKFIWSDHPDRDEAWEKAERAAMGDDVKFDREHACLFLSQDETLINPQTLAKLKGIEPLEITGSVRWYHKPQPNKTYLISLDPCMGTGNDDAAIQVFQLPEMIQAAEWRHNKTDIPGQLRVLRDIGRHIQEHQRAAGINALEQIYWTLENNSIGEAANIVIKEIGEDNFPGTYLSQSKLKGKRKGFYMSNRLKLEACSRFKTVVEKNKITIHSKALISQLKVFVSRGASYAAKGNEKDDLVMSSLLIVKMLERVMAFDDNVSNAFAESGEEFEDSSARQPLWGVF